MISTDIGIDLGTASILVYVKGKGVVLKEPSVVAFDRDTNKIKAIGEEARLMLKKRLLIIVDVFSIIILRVLMLMLEMMIIIKPVIKALMQNHVFGFLFGNLKIVIPVITVREQ